MSKGVLLDPDPGDIAIFSGFTPHRSVPNRSQEWPRLAYLSYNALSDGGDQREKSATVVDFQFLSGDTVSGARDGCCPGETNRLTDL